MKRISIVIIALVTTIVGFAQSDIRTYRIGVKLGTPNLASLEFEYLTPLLNNRVAPFVNYTGGTYTEDDVTAKLSTFEIGSNIYFSRNTEGRGLYGTLSYQKVNAQLEIEDYEANDGTIYEGNAKAEAAFNGLNIKIGAKLGKKFFFRTELGYSFGQLPKEIFVEGNFRGEPISETTSIEDEIEDLPVVFQNGIPIFNIGIGFAF